MSAGIILTLLGIGFYIANAALTRYYIEKSAPGLIEADLKLPKPRGNEEFLWERTAGIEIVPKWVSVVGLLAAPSFIIGLIVLLARIF